MSEAGTANPDDYRVYIPEEINVKKIRESLEMSQAEFAEHFGFSVRTLQEWEQGRSVPRGVAKNFLLLLQREPFGASLSVSLNYPSPTVPVFTSPARA